MAWTTSSPQRAAIACFRPSAMSAQIRLASQTHKYQTIAVIALAGLVADAELLLLACSGLFFAFVTAILTGVEHGLQARSQHLKASSSTLVKTQQPRLPAFAEMLQGREKLSPIAPAAWAGLAANMSHELRTPLNAVLGFSELMASEALGPLGSETYSAYARDIHASGRQLLKISEDAITITSLLTANREPGHQLTSDLWAAVDEAFAFHASTLLHSGLSVASTVSQPCSVIGDRQAIRQILINLVADALLYADGPCQLQVASAEGTTQTRLVLSLSTPVKPSRPAAEPFARQLANTLAQLSGISFAISPPESSEWYASLGFVPAVQADLFLSA